MQKDGNPEVDGHQHKYANSIMLPATVLPFSLSLQPAKSLLAFFPLFRSRLITESTLASAPEPLLLLRALNTFAMNVLSKAAADGNGKPASSVGHEGWGWGRSNVPTANSQHPNDPRVSSRRWTAAKVAKKASLAVYIW